MRAALLAGSTLLAALVELNNRRGGGSNPDIVLRPDRQGIDGNRPPIVMRLPPDWAPRARGFRGPEGLLSLSPGSPPCLSGVPPASP